MQCFLRKCTERHNPELSSDVGVEFKIVTPQTVSWDDKQNDEHHHRRKALVRFMNAGSKVILKYRMLKRLARIREFIGECSSKEEVKKLVD